MTPPNPTKRILLMPIAGLLLGSLWTAVGCKKNPANGQSAAALVASGQTAFASSGCMNCHSVGGQGGRRAPDLTHIGANAQHTADWIAAYAKDPKSEDPGSRMPPQGGKVNDADLHAIGAYLASLK